MPKFGKQSLARLATCDPNLQQICMDVVKHYDITVLEGYRDKATQNKAYDTGESKVPWPRSRHNVSPSKAVDIAPYPIDWDDTERFCYMAGLFMAYADRQGVQVRWGGNWDRDGVILSDQEFDDLPHFELI